MHYGRLQTSKNEFVKLFSAKEAGSGESLLLHYMLRTVIETCCVESSLTDIIS